MKNNTKKIIAAALALTVALGGSCYAFASQAKNEDKKNTDSTETVSELTEAVSGPEVPAEEENSIEDAVKTEDEKIVSDDEVVYVFTDANGQVSKVMDSILIENDKETEEAEKAESAKDLPVTIKVSYSLDGKAIAPEELAGKSGHLSIDVTFTDNAYEVREINGKNEKIYVPFMASTVMVLDSEKYSNVTVSNGRVVFDGARYAVAGIALPGLKEDLQLDAELEKEKDKIPESVKIEADVEDCEISGMYMLLSNSVFSDLSVDTDEKLEELRDDLGKIDDAMEALMNGSDELYNGLDKLLTGSNTFSDGLTQLTDGLDTLASNSDALTSGAAQVFNSLLQTAQAQLAESGIDVGTLTIDNYGTVLAGLINDGYVRNMAYAKVEQSVRENTSTINEAVTAAVYSQVESGVEAAVRQQVTEGVKEKVAESIRPQVEAAVRAQVEAQVKGTVEERVKAEVVAAVAQQSGITAEEVLADETMSAYVNGQVKEKMSSDEIQTTIASNTDAQMSSDDVKNLIESKVNEQLATEDAQKIITQNTDAQMNTDEIKSIIDAKTTEKESSSEISELIDQKTEETVLSKISEYQNSDEVNAQISEGDRKILNLIASLDGYAQFYNGVIKYTQGVNEADTGANKLKNAMPELIEGIKALKEGSGKLSDGLKEFNDEGIVKLNDIVDDTLEGFVERFDAVKEVAADYTSYDTESGISKNSVKFIYKIDSVKSGR